MTLPRKVQVVVMAMLAAVTLAVVSAGPAPGATAFTVSGTRARVEPPYPEQLLPAHFAGDTISRVDYPAALFGMDRSIAIAATGITTGVLATAGSLTAAGFSQGAIAVAYAKKQLMALPEDQRPAADRLDFITVGDPSGPGGILSLLRRRVPLIGLTPFTGPDTPYDTIFVTGEYDGWADFPDRPWNLVSLANALLGITYIHGRYEKIPGGLDLSTVSAVNITTTVNSLGGSTTTYLVPTEKLPLVQPLRDLGVPERIVTALEGPLKKAVDRGYTRHDSGPAKSSAKSSAQSSATLSDSSSAAATVRAAPRQIRQPERRPASQSQARSPGRSAAVA